MFKADNQLKNNKNVETVIGPSVKVEGEFHGEGDVIVEGIVVGNLSTQHYLRIGSEAKVQAKIGAQNIYIAGEIIGNITAQDSVEITNTASVKGDIIAKSISIEKGAVVNGKISMSEPSSVSSKKISDKQTEGTLE